MGRVKLIVNNSADCDGHDGGSGGAADFWIGFEGDTSRVPLKDVYDDFADMEYSELFHSQCYEEMSGYDQDASDTFEYAELMLFNIDADPIEACDLAEAEPEIVERLLAQLNAEVRGQYLGSTEGVPTAAATLRQFLSYDCEREQTFLLSWEDDECCSDTDPDAYVWDDVWVDAMNEKKDKCD